MPQGFMLTADSVRLLKRLVREELARVRNRPQGRGPGRELPPIRHSLRGKAASEISAATSTTPGSGTVNIWRPVDPADPTGAWEDSGETEEECLWFGEQESVPTGVWLSLTWSWEARRYEIAIKDCE